MNLLARSSVPTAMREVTPRIRGRRFGARLGAALVLGLVAQGAGCVYYYEDEVCGYHAYFDEFGYCTCDAGYAGDAYYECFRCGDHTDAFYDEYYDETVCVCRDGYAGDPYVGCEVAPEWWIADFCDDGLDVEWRLFSQSENWSWPGDGGVFVTPGFGIDQFERTFCEEGETICWGAVAGDRQWGVGIDGDLPCDDCCFDCAPATYPIGDLKCD